MKRSSIGPISLTGSIGVPPPRDLAVGDQIAVQRRRKIQREPDRLIVLNGGKF